MEQQDAKNLITLEKFLDSLKDIISNFKSYVDTTNKKIDDLSEAILQLSKRVNENTSIARETKKDSTNKIDNLGRELAESNNDLLMSISGLEKTVGALKDAVIKDVTKKATTKPKQKPEKKDNNAVIQKNSKGKKKED